MLLDLFVSLKIKVLRKRWKEINIFVQCPTDNIAVYEKDLNDATDVGRLIVFLDRKIGKDSESKSQIGRFKIEHEKSIENQFQQIYQKSTFVIDFEKNTRKLYFYVQ